MLHISLSVFKKAKHVNISYIHKRNSVDELLKPVSTSLCSLRRCSIKRLEKISEWCRVCSYARRSVCYTFLSWSHVTRRLWRRPCAASQR